ncbi:unnamed protein product [Rhizoctonia solani]|uniref:Uncharacterized protein n=1 Tax=Rhizoctonia solani TaxID=456999 RepID=A0A8H3AQR0_9AGAM|nr:unnamed protein product [Rhizoctonia solani]
MSHDLPPPYYASVATLEAEQRDIASLIRQLSQDIVKADQNFNDVRTLLQGKFGAEVAPPSLKDNWRGHRQVFINMIWDARRAATSVESRNQNFLEVILPLIGDAGKSKESKISLLEKFCAKPLPEFLTSTESTDKVRGIDSAIPDLLKVYEENADKLIDSSNTEIVRLEAERDKQKEREEAAKEKEKDKKSSSSWFSSRPTSHPGTAFYSTSEVTNRVSKIEAINKQRNELKSTLADIRFALNTIPDQVGQSFLTVWTHLTNDATHLKNRLGGSTSDPMPDLPAVTRVYREINSALKYYATNVSKTG